MKKVNSIVLNCFTNDNRVLKENLSLKKAGFDVCIIAMHEEGLKIKDKVEGIPIYRIQLCSKKWPKSFIFSAFKYFEFLYKAVRQSRNSDYIHCNDLETLPVGVFRKTLNKHTKIIYDAHEFEIYRTTTASPKRLWLNKNIEKHLIKKVDSVITVSDSIADEYKILYNIKRPELIYNCPFYKPVPQPKKNLFRKKFNIHADQKIFLYQGALTIGRGIDQIIDAFSTMDNNEFVVIFMGYGHYKHKVIEASQKNDNIFFKTAVPIHEINDYSNSADWGLLTIENVSKSYNYSLPNKLFEYVMAEIPTLAFPTYEIKNKIQDYNVGIVAENESSEALSKAIKDTKDIDISTFQTGMNQMKSIFNWAAQEKKLIQLYNSLH